MTARLSLLLLSGLLGTGCYSYKLMQPTELPKIGRVMVGSVVQGPHAGRAVAVGVTRVKRPDGRLMEVSGRPTIRVTKSDGNSAVFKHPVRAKLEKGRMVIESGNQPRTVFRMQDIQSVAVKKLNGWTWFWGIVGVLVVPAIITTSIVLANP